MVNVSKREKIVSFVRQKWVNNNGLRKAIIGLSGGADSNVACALMVTILGADNVYGYYLPHGDDEGKKIHEQKNIQNMCDELGVINFKRIDITSQYQAAMQIMSNNPCDNLKVVKMNLPPRLRVAYLLMMANSIEGGRMINTANFDETFVGYATKCADSSGDFFPLLRYHKSQVLKLGQLFGLNENWYNMEPCDGLSGQTDKESLGFGYDEVEDFFRNRYPSGPGQPQNASYCSGVGAKIYARMQGSRHKLIIHPGDTILPNVFSSQVEHDEMSNFFNSINF